MVEAVKAGRPVRAVARQFGISRPTVERWVARAAKQRLDCVDWTDGASIPHRIHRTVPEIEAQILALRGDLRERSALGESGAPSTASGRWRRGARRLRSGPSGGSSSAAAPSTASTGSVTLPLSSGSR
jgi:transposase